MSETEEEKRVYVDIIIPVHNASETIEATVRSALLQETSNKGSKSSLLLPSDVAICCYDDGSTDDSLQILRRLQNEFPDHRIVIESGHPSRGAGYARNRAAAMRPLLSKERHVLIWLDSDDIMKPNRIQQQVRFLLDHPDREKLLLGSKFERDPPDSTWHYTQWANQLPSERLWLEQFRELTILQPTWAMMKARFQALGGYIEAPINRTHDEGHKDDDKEQSISSSSSILRLIHKDIDDSSSLRLAEDLRFWFAHLHHDGGCVARIDQNLLAYRHRLGQSQSSQTPRKLLLALRVLAFEKMVLSRQQQQQQQQQHTWSQFVVWGAGRDGKDFVKSLSDESRQKVYCFVDVDHKKIEAGHYFNRELGINIPIVHFSLLCPSKTTQQKLQEAYWDQADNKRGRIKKGGSKSEENSDNDEGNIKLPPRKKFKVCAIKQFDTSKLLTLPVVVCVAMYRSNGVLEKNVESIERKEGKTLWHFS